MKSLLSLILVVITSTASFAGDYCYLQPNSHYSQTYNYNNAAKIEVINNQLSLYPAQVAVQEDVAAKQAFALEYQRILDTIPIKSSQKQMMRRFEFANNTPTYVATAKVQKNVVQTETVVKTYQLNVSQSIVIKNGVLSLNMPHKAVYHAR